MVFMLRENMNGCDFFKTPAAPPYPIVPYKCMTPVSVPFNGLFFFHKVVIGTDCIGSCKSNYHTIMTTI